WVGRLPLSINIRQGVSNVLQKKWRMAFTVLTLTIAAGAFMGVFAVFTSVNTLIDDFLATFNFNFYTIPNLTSVDEDLADAERIILADMGGLMTAKGPYTVVAGRIDGYEKIYDPNTGPPALFVYGYEPETE